MGSKDATLEKDELHDQGNDKGDARHHSSQGICGKSLKNPSF